VFLLSRSAHHVNGAAEFGHVLRARFGYAAGEQRRSPRFSTPAAHAGCVGCVGMGRGFAIATTGCTPVLAYKPVSDNIYPLRPLGYIGLYAVRILR
jgi:hypothetical protein